VRVLITGAEGFAGSTLIRHLLGVDAGLELHGTVRFSPADYPHLGQTLASATQIDLRVPAAVLALMDRLKPDMIYHLAAQAFVPRSFEDPWETLENNIRSQLNLFLAAIKLNIAPRCLIVGSAEVYGIVPPQDLPITEDFPLQPTNPYSVSKVGQDMLALQYHLSHGLPIVRVRPFNHIGPGQNPGFVAPAFATQIARIEQGLQPPVIKVGDLSPQRDFTDVRDVVRAYHLALTNGQPGAVYNVCSGCAYSIQYLLDVLLEHSDVAVEVTVDPERLRPVEQPVVRGSFDRLQADTGWRPEISFRQSLVDVLAECRQRVRHEQEQPEQPSRSS